MRSLNPSPIFLAGVTDRTSMLHIFSGSSGRENSCCITWGYKEFKLKGKKNISCYSRYWILLKCFTCLLSLIAIGKMPFQQFLMSLIPIGNL